MAKKYRRYKNGLEMYLSSKKGRRVLNFAYSWGAAVAVSYTHLTLPTTPYV